MHIKTLFLSPMAVRMTVIRAFLSLSLVVCSGLLPIYSGSAHGRELNQITDEMVSQSLETSRFEDLEKKALELADMFGPNNILIAYDVDNTLLATNQLLGGDQWYNWQAAEMKKPQPNDAITTDEEEFARICSRILAVSGMHPPQPEIPAIVARLQDRRIPSIVLTARRYDLRDITVSALTDNTMDMNSFPIGSPQGYPGTYLPYDLDHPETNGLTMDLVKTLDLPKARPVSYQNGIFMADGLHKGAMLRTLMHKTGRKFKAILFIDDTPHNVRDVQAAFIDTDVAVFTYRYGREDQNVKEFIRSDKSDVKEAWQMFDATLKKLFPKAS